MNADDHGARLRQIIAQEMEKLEVEQRAFEKETGLQNLPGVSFTRSTDGQVQVYISRTMSTTKAKALFEFLLILDRP